MAILTLILQRAGSSLPRHAIAVLMVLGLVLLPAKAAMADDSLEYGVKAAFLYKFSFYVEWPAAAFTSPTSPINLCIAGGGDPFGPALEKVAGGESVNGRSVVVRRIKTVERDAGCHILYIGASEAQRSAQIMETVRGSNVLTVSDTGGAGETGIIDFVIVNNRVRFNIDDEAAAQNGLVISSKLMSLALNVKRRTTQGVRK
ncbi:MAG TPA: YfiR family protein [Methylotenera sp.]|nr:YfiR family protein [Methylotenera sp.]